jgi:hypothetical protein
VGAQFSGGGIDDLKFFLDANRESVMHERHLSGAPAGMQEHITFPGLRSLGAGRGPQIIGSGMEEFVRLRAVVMRRTMPDDRPA